MANRTPRAIPEPPICNLLGRLTQDLKPAGIKAFIVGGLVRDIVLKRKTADIDLAVPGDALKTAEEVAGFTGGSYVPLHEKNRIGRVVLTDLAGTSGRTRWTLDFTTIEDTIYDDLARRDFNIDAMAYDLSEFVRDPEKAWLIDPFGGLNDLHDRIVRAVSNTVFTEDPLRLLRAFRLASELGFTIDAGTEFLIKSDAYLIATDSRGAYAPASQPEAKPPAS
jgi:poly(A) polymerase